MNEEKRIAILSNHIPKRYVDIYLYLLYEDMVYLPKSFIKCNGVKRVVDNDKLQVYVEKLCVLLSKPLHKLSSFYREIPQRYIDIYLYVYDKENINLLPQDLIRPNTKRYIKKIALRKEIKNLAILMASRILNLSEVC